MPAWDRAYRQATNTLARELDARVAAAYGSYLAGRVTEPEAVQVIAALIARAQRRTVTAQDVLLAQELSDQLGRQVDPLGLDWPEDYTAQQARLGKAVRTVFGAEPEYVAAIADPRARAAEKAVSVRLRLNRLTTNEVQNAAQRSRQDAAIAQAPATGIVGYLRVLSPGACSLCRTIAGAQPERFVRPLTARFAAHPTGSCQCTMRMVTADYLDDRGVKWLGPAGTRPKSAAAIARQPVRI